MRPTVGASDDFAPASALRAARRDRTPTRAERNGRTRGGDLLCMLRRSRSDEAVFGVLELVEFCLLLEEIDLVVAGPEVHWHVTRLLVPVAPGTGIPLRGVLHGEVSHTPVRLGHEDISVAQPCHEPFRRLDGELAAAAAASGDSHNKKASWKTR